MSMENVLDEVELFIQKLSALPDEVRNAAFNKIQDSLKSNINTFNDAVKPSQVSKSINKNISIDKGHSSHESLSLQKPSVFAELQGTRIEDTTVDGEEKLQRSTAKILGKKRNPRVARVVHVNVQLATVQKKSGEILQLQIHKAQSNKERQCLPLDEQSTVNIDKPNVMIDKRNNSSIDKRNGIDTAQKVNVLRCLPKRIRIINKCNSDKNALSVSDESNTTINDSKYKKNYACYLCEKSFRAAPSLKVHMKRHYNQRDFVCDHCSYRSVAKLDLERHFMSNHSDTKDFICEYCAKSFSIRRSLILHIRNIHKSRAKQFFCAECSFSTHSKRNLRVHICLRHLEDYYTHVCPVCTARVKQKSAFLEHMRAHTGDRPFPCTHGQCTASFASLGRLNTHLRTIHGPKQFSCSFCDKMFPTKYSKQRHETIHTNVKPHLCPFCSFACNSQGNLTKHIRNKHAQPDFSLKQYKRTQLSSLDNKILKDKKKWTAKGQEAVEQYLSDLSGKLGRKVTLDELKAQEEYRKQQMTIMKERAKIERINKITSKEHSYVQKPPRTPSPVPSSIGPLTSNIYLEAMAAANLDFTTTTLAESIHIPDLSYNRPFPEMKFVTCNLEPIPDFESGNNILPDVTDDKMDPLLSNYSDVLHVPASLGLEPFPVGPTLVEVPGLFVQFPSGEKLNLNMLRDSQLMDIAGMVGEPLQTPSLPMPQMECLLPSAPSEYMPSVMIVVNDPVDTTVPS